MSGRSSSPSQICGACCHWSQLVASWTVESGMRAICESATGPKRGTMTGERDGCGEFIPAEELAA